MSHLALKWNSRNMVPLALVLYFASICLFGDANFPLAGVALTFLSLALAVFYEVRYRFAGLLAVVNTACFWWLLGLLLAILLTLGNVFAQDRKAYYIDLVTMIETIFVFGVFMYRSWDRTLLADISVLSAAVLCAWITLHEYPAMLGITADTRIGWSAAGGNPNEVGIQLGYFSAITLYEFVVGKKIRYLVATLVQYGFMLLTGSKKIFLFIAASMLLLLFLKSRKHTALKFLILAAAFAAFFILVMNVPVLYDILGIRVNRMLLAVGITGYQQDTSTTERMDYVRVALSAWESRPLFGYGFQAFHYVLGMGTYSHNNYTEILLSFGAVGLFYYYFIYLFELWGLARIRAKNADADLFLMLAVVKLVVDVGAVSYYDEMFNIIVLLGGWYLFRYPKKEAAPGYPL